MGYGPTTAVTALELPAPRQGVGALVPITCAYLCVLSVVQYAPIFTLFQVLGTVRVLCLFMSFRYYFCVPVGHCCPSLRVQRAQYYMTAAVDCHDSDR